MGDEMEDILLISKDAFKTDYLSCYGGDKWETPNIDSLAKSGTIFRNFYTFFFVRDFSNVQFNFLKGFIPGPHIVPLIFIFCII